MEINIGDIDAIIIKYYNCSYFDVMDVVIPSKKIKKLKYSAIKKYDDYVLGKNIYLELDYKYIDTHNSQWGDYLEFDESILEVLQKEYIASIIIKYKNEKSIELKVPSCKNYTNTLQEYENLFIKNLCLHQKRIEDTYVVEWKRLQLKDMRMNTKEIKEFFNQKLLSTIFNGYKCLGIEMVDRILDLNLKDNSIYDQVEEESREDGKQPISFKGVKENFLKIKNNIENSNGNEGYQLIEINSQNSFETILQIKKRSYLCNFNFIVVPNLDKGEDKRLLYEVLYQGQKKDNEVCINIALFNDDVDMARFARAFFRDKDFDNGYMKECDNQQEKNIEKSFLLFAKYSEFNQIWYDIHKEWNLL